VITSGKTPSSNGVSNEVIDAKRRNTAEEYLLVLNRCPMRSFFAMEWKRVRLELVRRRFNKEATDFSNY